MKHAGAETLSSLERLLRGLRGQPGLVERKPGIFYVRSRAYLHFHEDPAGVFVDIKLTEAEFQRFPVNTRHEQDLVLNLVAHNRAS